MTREEILNKREEFEEKLYFLMKQYKDIVELDDGYDGDFFINFIDVPSDEELAYEEKIKAIDGDILNSLILKNNKTIHIPKRQIILDDTEIEKVYIPTLCCPPEIVVCGFQRKKNGTKGKTPQIYKLDVREVLEFSTLLN